MIGLSRQVLEGEEFALVRGEDRQRWDGGSAFQASMNRGLDEYNLYDVYTKPEERVLECVLNVEMERDSESFISSASVDQTFLLQTPDGDPVLSIDAEAGKTPPYEFRDVSDGSDRIIGTWETALFGGTGLKAPSGDVVLTRTSRSIGKWLRDAVSLSTRHTVVLENPDGSRACEIERVPAEGGGLDWLDSELAVTMAGTDVPPEIPVGLGVMLELRRISSSHARTDM